MILSEMLSFQRKHKNIYTFSIDGNILLQVLAVQIVTAIFTNITNV